MGRHRAEAPEPEDELGGAPRLIKVKRKRTIFNSRTKRRRARKIGLWILGVAVVLGTLWVTVTAAMAKRSADELQIQLAQLQAHLTNGDTAKLTSAANDVRESADRLHTLTSGPAWWIGAHIPVLGDPLEVIRGSAKAADQLGEHTVPVVIRLSQDLSPEKLQTGPGTVNVGALANASPLLVDAAISMQETLRIVEKLPSNTWSGKIDASRAVFETRLASVAKSVQIASAASQVLPDLLGQNGTKRYFVGLQNEAELRGLGGLPGSFAILEANKGKISFTRFGSDFELQPAATGGLVKTGLDFGDEFKARYGSAAPTELYVNSNLSPHFPYAAQTWVTIWEKLTKQRLDGAIAYDPTALSYLLSATGPTTMPDGRRVTAENVVSLTSRDAYALFPNFDVRKQFLIDLSKAVDNHVVTNVANPRGIVLAAARAVSERRLLIWSRDAAMQAQLAATPASGVIPETTAPFVGVVLNNLSSGKLDYYLRRTVAYNRGGCGEGGVATVTITLTNEAPVRGLPPYVAERVDKPAPGTAPLGIRQRVSYYGTTGSQLLGVTLDGKVVGLAVFSELGHPVFQMDMELPRGQTRTLVVTLREPPTTALPIVLNQPLVQHSKAVVRQACS